MVYKRLSCDLPTSYYQLYIALSQFWLILCALSLETTRNYMCYVTNLRISRVATTLNRPHSDTLAGISRDVIRVQLECSPRVYDDSLFETHDVR